MWVLNATYQSWFKQYLLWDEEKTSLLLNGDKFFFLTTEVFVL